MKLVRVALVVMSAVCTLAVSQVPPTPPTGFQPARRHGDLVFLSGFVHARPGGAFAEEAATALEELNSAVTAGGSTMDRVVSTSVYLSRAEDFAALNAVWKKYWPVSPPARTTIVATLPAPGARIMISAIAAMPGSRREAVQPSAWAAPPGPLSYAVRAGDTVFLSGIVPRRGTDNSLVTGDIETQTNAVFENAEAILKSAGLTLADVVSARVFLTDGSVFDRMNAAYRARFPADPPARATVITPLVSPDFQIEITMVAAKSGGRVAALTPNADGSPGRANPNLSAAICVGPRLFLSGMLGVLPGNASDVTGQTTETLNRLQRTMTAAGFGWSDALDAVVYVTDVALAPEVMKVLASRVAGHLMPAGAVVGAGLVSPEGRVEIMLTAGK
jgi:enamine deaminase RidA (YjgF/YER057c/UK114 family)